MLDDLIAYYTAYGSKSCFFPDVQSYLLTLPPAQRLLLLEAYARGVRSRTAGLASCWVAVMRRSATAAHGAAD